MSEDKVSVSDLRKRFEPKPPLKPEPALKQMPLNQPSNKPKPPLKSKPELKQMPFNQPSNKNVPIKTALKSNDLELLKDQQDNNNDSGRDVATSEGNEEGESQDNTYTTEEIQEDNAKQSEDTAKEVLRTVVQEIRKTFERTVADDNISETDGTSQIETDTASSRSSPSRNGNKYKSDSGLSASGIDSDDETVKERENIEYMIEIYMPYIKHQIKVTDIIDHLDFIGARERDIIFSKDRYCASDAFELLLSAIKRSKTEGKWQTFLKALDDKEFKYIKELLEGKTEIHHDGNRHLLRLVTPELVYRLDVLLFLDKAFEKQLLTVEDKSTTESKLREHGEHEAIRFALERVDKYKKDWNSVLIAIFKQEEFFLGDIVELFEFIEQEEEKDSVKGATNLSWKRQNSVRKAREWYEKHHAKGDIQNSANSDRDGSSTLESLHEEFSANEQTQRLLPTFYQDLPTHQDFVKLTSEIRKLRKMIERKEQ